MKVFTEIAGLDETFKRPVIKQVASRVCQVLSIDNPYVQYGGRKLTKRNLTGRDTGEKGIPNIIVNISAKETPLDGGAKMGTNLNEANDYVYKDKEVNSSVSTRYTTYQTDITFVIKSISKEKTDNLLDRIKVLINTGDIFATHNLSYSIMLPKTVLSFIKAVYNNKKAVKNDLVLDNYIKDTMCDKIDSFEHLSGDGRYELKLNETQGDVMGYFLAEAYEIESNEETGYNTIEFIYRLSYKKPYLMLLDVPMFVYNKPLPRPFNNSYLSNSYDVKQSNSAGIVDLLKENNLFGINSNGNFLTLPKNDSFIPKEKAEFYQPVMSLAIQIEDKSTDLFNIKNIGGLKFKKPLLDFILEEGEHVGKQYGSIIYLKLYEGEYGSSVELHVDSDGIVKAKEPLDIKKQYRVMIYCLGNTGLLNCDNSKRVMEFLNKQIENSVEKVREFKSLYPLEYQGSNRELSGTGLEQEDFATFIDVYFDFFEVTKDMYKTYLDRTNSKNASEILFKVRINKQGWVPFSSTNFVNVDKLFTKGG